MGVRYMELSDVSPEKTPGKNQKVAIDILPRFVDCIDLLWLIMYL